MDEIEVKISWSDYKAEWKKRKHNITDTWDFAPYSDANRRFFAAPMELAQRIAKDTDAVKRGYGVYGARVKENSPSGVIEVVCIKRAKKLHDGHIPSMKLRYIVMRMANELLTVRRAVRN